MTTPPTPPTPAPQPTSGGGSQEFLRRLVSQEFLGRLVSNKMVLGAVVAGAAVIAIVVVVFAIGIIGGGGRTAPADFILDSSASVVIVNVAAILASQELPSQLASFSSLGMPGINPDDPEDWKYRWRDKWTDDFPEISGAIGLDDITAAMLQTNANGKALGWVFKGEFPFADIRDSLEDTDSNSDTYRSFEIWDGEIALLEDNGVIVVGAFAQDLLKSLDTDRGFLDDSSALKQALAKSGEGLVINSAAGCNSSFFQTSLNGCDAIVEVVKSGDAATSLVTGAYLFSSEGRAESSLDDIEDAVDKQSAYDADINRIEADGQLVTYEVTIIGGFIGSGTGEGENPQDFILKDAQYVIVQNVATILETEFPDGIPQQMSRLQGFYTPGVNLEDAEEWKEDWRDRFAENATIWLDDAITLDEVTYVMAIRSAEGYEGVVISGGFDFENVRAALEKQDLKEGEYRDFETWDDDDDTVALLEDRGIIVIGAEFVQEFLKALDKSEFADDSSALKRALDKAGPSLMLLGTPGCESTFFPISEIRRCEAIVDTVNGGDVEASEVSGVYVFRSPERAESGLSDIEDAIKDQRDVDADLEKLVSDGEYVTYQATIHQDYNPPTPTPTPAPAPAPAGDDKYQVALAFLNCGLANDNSWVMEQVQQYGSIDQAAESIVAEHSLSALLDARYEECGY